MGLSTRVDTIVAMELAASCSPLRKSNSNATPISPTRAGNPSSTSPMGSHVLDDHALKLVGNIIEPVNDLLKVVVDLVSGDEPHRVAAVPLEQRLQADVMEIIGAPLDLRNLLCDRVDSPRLLADRTQQRDRLFNKQRTFDDGIAHLLHFGREGAYVEQHHGLGGFLHLVDGIIHRGDEVLDAPRSNGVMKLRRTAIRMSRVT